MHFIRETGAERHALGLRHVQLRRLHRPIDGKAVKSCTQLAAMVQGHEVRTIEGLEIDGQLDPLQQGFHEMHALHCGFCTPGMILASRSLLDQNPNPTEQEIRVAISGGICRCTGYKNIVAAVQWAAQHQAEIKQEA